MADQPEPYELAAEVSKLQAQLAELQQRLSSETATPRKVELQNEIDAVQYALSDVRSQIATLATTSRDTFDPSAAGRHIDQFRELGEALAQGLGRLPDLDALNRIISNFRQSADSLLKTLGGGGARKWPP